MNSLGANGNGFDRGGSGPSDCIAYPNLYQVFGSQGTTVASQIQVCFRISDGTQAIVNNNISVLVKGVELGASSGGKWRKRCCFAEDFPNSGGSYYEEER